ncbi:toxin-antitoxin system YwqK family antitoxin [Pseudaquabacterium rugosum]|uniref:Toxin-antitoxin system YwqK family antitoxin n=1 Tax=Pseudaquabacterium rugosum TaxID=2984194 RepID=A0ABU9BJI9_9BURK
MQDLHIAEISYESGAVHFRYSRVLSEDGTRWIRQGLFVEYSESGVVLAEGSYLNGKEEGSWCSFHENGQKASEGLYTDGKEEGTWHFWNSTGQPEESVIYRGGEEVGKK